MTLSRPSLELTSLTHSGMVRSHNEDHHMVDAARGLAILADGMGGYNAGEVASEMAVSQLAAGLGDAAADAAPAALVRRQVERINAAIYDAAQSQPQCAGMGTTLVSALFRPGRMTVAHVGDSRLYRWRGGAFQAITRDHSLLQEQIDSGLISVEEARRSHNKNLVTRALGVEPTVEVEVHEHDTQPGDLYLLCSDGLNDMVADDDIERVLHAYGTQLSAAAQQLVQLANHNGGRDNVTVILARVLEKPVERGMLARLAAWVRPGAAS
ncbi:Stp1/IreP family PP2C-type Ser/Thr phosphatase [Massilia sp. R2A-15]|uniref:Stp1/IreP family PP2C-type Ser/Thr phosphatase n=1 Tax=Massilia sp. R2A-15 TaxID=3064278 RepID=UPI00273330D2|nr:Stp1/IreP family PP2C-type Ser/Thr phosphatase [Massilia sp. R2A-15]WLI89474.1 Stp1/IreP family PP2C-type Ser/Thr phosphatase [Massilia sp. R2A-15]